MNTIWDQSDNYIDETEPFRKTEYIEYLMQDSKDLGSALAMSHTFSMP